VIDNEFAFCEQWYQPVHVIARRTLKEAARKHSGISTGLDTWFQIAKRASWKSLEDIRKTYPKADGVGVGKRTYIVFDIGGNKFRLIVKIEYAYRKIFVKHVLTHAEYSKGEWKQ
jgi:mRNA interferase HigB